MAMTPECYRKVAAETLEDKRTIDLVNTLNRGICERVPDTVISSDFREEIWAATTSIKAAGFIRKALKASEDPNKMDVLLTALESTQRHHAEKIGNVHQEYITDHNQNCDLCHVWDLPTTVATQETGN